jgi:SNF2 family DNA or RNA helicase
MAKACLQKALSNIMIERKKADVLGEQLTAKTEELILCDPSPLQKEVYRHVVELPDFDIVKRGHAPCDCGVNRRFFQKFYHLNTQAERVDFYRNHKKEIVKQSKCHHRLPWNPRRGVAGEPEIDPDAAIWRSMKSHNKDKDYTPCENCPWCCSFPCIRKLTKLSSHVGLIQAEKIPENEQSGSPAFIKYTDDREFARVALAGVVDRLPGGNLDRSNSITDDHFKLSGKLVVLDRLLTAFYEEGSRVLLFAHSTQLLDLVGDTPCEYLLFFFCVKSPVIYLLTLSLSFSSSGFVFRFKHG